MERTVEIATLGSCTVDGAPVQSRRAVELVALLALSGGRAQRDWMMVNLFEGEPAPSSLPTIALRARKLGLPARYDRYRGFYWLEEDVRCDVVELLALLKEKRLAEALDRYEGPFLPASHSPFALEVRTSVENAIVRAVLDQGDVELMARADRLVKHPELSQELVNRGADTATVSLSRSWLSALGVAG